MMNAIQHYEQNVFSLSTLNDIILLIIYFCIPGRNTKTELLRTEAWSKVWAIRRWPCPKSFLLFVHGIWFFCCKTALLGQSIIGTDHHWDRLYWEFIHIRFVGHKNNLQGIIRLMWLLKPLFILRWKATLAVCLSERLHWQFVFFWLSALISH